MQLAAEDWDTFLKIYRTVVQFQSDAIADWDLFVHRPKPPEPANLVVSLLSIRFADV